MRASALMAVAFAAGTRAQTETGPIGVAQRYWMASMELEESECTPFCDPTDLLNMFDDNATLVDASSGDISGREDINNYLFAEFNFLLPMRGMRRQWRKGGMDVRSECVSGDPAVREESDVSGFECPQVTSTNAAYEYWESVKISDGSPYAPVPEAFSTTEVSPDDKITFHRTYYNYPSVAAQDALQAAAIEVGESYWNEYFRVQDSGCQPFCEPDPVADFYAENAVLVDPLAGEIPGKAEITNFLFAELNLVAPADNLKREWRKGGADVQNLCLSDDVAVQYESSLSGFECPQVGTESVSWEYHTAATIDTGAPYPVEVPEAFSRTEIDFDKKISRHENYFNY